MMEFMTFDVGGMIFKTKRQNLLTYPSTRLGKMAQETYDEDPVIIDRNHTIFSNILDFYRLGELHLPQNVCAAATIKELEYWDIHQSHIAECCLKIITEYEESVKKHMELKRRLDDVEIDYNSKEVSENKAKQLLRQTWLFFDRPNSSKPAFVSINTWFTRGINIRLKS